MSAIKHGMLSVNGLKLHYAELGSGEPILFLHGFPEFWGAWEPVMEALSSRFRAIALDTRGINLSEGPDTVEGYQVDALVEDIRQAIMALGCPKVTLVGHDWGGFIAWEVAIRHPEILKRLVIVNAAHPGIFDKLLRELPAQAAASKYMLAFRSPRGEELLSRNDFAGFRREITDPFVASGEMSPARADEYLSVWRRSLTAGLNYYRANKSGPPSGDDARPRNLDETIVRLPTLVIWGEKDPYFALENIEMIRDVVPDLRIRKFPDCNHWIIHQKGEDVCALITAFMDGELPADGVR